MVAFIIIGNKFVIHVDDKCCIIGAGQLYNHRQLKSAYIYK